MSPAELELHRTLYVNDHTRLFLEQVKEGLQNTLHGLAQRIAYKDFSVRLSRGHVDPVDQFNNTVRHVVSEVRTIGDGKIGRRLAMLTSFRHIGAHVRRDHLSLRLEAQNGEKEMLSAWRFQFAFAKGWEENPSTHAYMPDMSRQVMDAMDHFIRTGMTPSTLVILPGFQRLL